MRKVRRSQAMVRGLLVLGSICRALLAPIRVSSAGGPSVCPTIQGNRGAKSQRMSGTLYPTENTWFAITEKVIHFVIRISGVQFDAHLCNISSKAFRVL